MRKEVLCTVMLALMASLSVKAGGELGDSSRVYDIDEVVVVSQGKEVFRIRQQPLSSTLLSRNELQRLGARDLRDVAVNVPSFVMPAYGSRLTSAIYVRGIGSRVNSPAIGIYIDGIPLVSKAAFNFHSYQLDRVDVLRGPQGTLYGLNSEGGLVRIYSRQPMKNLGTELHLSLGSHLWRSFEVAHNECLNENLALGIAGFYSGQNGFFRNVGTGERADVVNEAGGKVHLAYRPADHWSIDFMTDYQYVRQNGFPYGLLDITTRHTAAPATNFQSNYRRNLLTVGLDLGFKAKTFNFHSISSYQYVKDAMLMDQDYLPQDYMHLCQRQFQNALTQEFSFKSPHPIGGRWHWALGTFFSSQWLRTDGPVSFGEAMTSMIAKAMMVSPFISNVRINMGAPGTYWTPQQNLAFYHESNIVLSSKLTATLGLRYDYTHVGVHYNSSAYMQLKMLFGLGSHAVPMEQTTTSTYDGRTHNDFNQLLPKIGLRYTLDRWGSNVYATVSKGYRAGGYNIQMFSDILSYELRTKGRGTATSTIAHTSADYDAVNHTISYQPETTWNYEVGTHLNLFEGSMQFDVSAYFMQIRNQQLSVMAGNYGFGRMMVNAGKSHSYGLETTLRGQSLRGHLDWNISYGLTQAVFRNYNDSLTTATGKLPISYKGKRIPYVPMHTLSAMADYKFNVQHGWLHSVTIGANVHAQGNIYWDEANTYKQRFYAVSGAHADVDFGALKLSVWGRNLTNTKYNTFAVQSAATGQKLTFAQLGDLAQFGVDLHVNI